MYAQHQQPSSAPLAKQIVSNVVRRGGNFLVLHILRRAHSPEVPGKNFSGSQCPSKLFVLASTNSDTKSTATATASREMQDHGTVVNHVIASTVDVAETVAEFSKIVLSNDGSSHESSGMTTHIPSASFGGRSLLAYCQDTLDPYHLHTPRTEACAFVHSVEAHNSCYYAGAIQASDVNTGGVSMRIWTGWVSEQL